MKQLKFRGSSKGSKQRESAVLEVRAPLLPESVGGSNARTGQAITTGWPDSSPLIFPRLEIAHASGPAAYFWDDRTRPSQ
jgi:hypothetical protein